VGVGVGVGVVAWSCYVGGCAGGCVGLWWRGGGCGGVCVDVGVWVRVVWRCGGVVAWWCACVEAWRRGSEVVWRCGDVVVWWCERECTEACGVGL